MQIEGTTAIVTGAASGLGAATVRELVRRGATAVGFDLPDAVEQAPEVAGVSYASVDVTDADQVRAAVEQATARPEPLRTVVNCAGIAPSARVVGRTGAHDAALFASVVQVNLIGTFNVLSVAAEKMSRLPVLANGQRGVVVNTASIAAFEGQIGQAAYASSKGGVVALTLAAARDLAQHGIRVNTVAPGIVATPMLATIADDYRTALAADVPFPKRLAEPEEYAALVAFLVDHDYMNGETVRMDGALRMNPR